MASTRRASKKPASKKPASKKPASKKPASKKSASKKPASKKPASKKPASKKPASKKPATRHAFVSVAPSIPIVELTPLRREQLALAIELGVGRRTTPDRLPKHYFEIPAFTALWHVLEDGVHRFDYLMSTLFFAGTAEPVGIEWVQGSFIATGRDATRGLSLDLPRLAWELQHAWPGRKLQPGDEPPDSRRFTPSGPGLRDLTWDPTTEFV